MIRANRAHSVLLFCALLLGIPTVAKAGGGSTLVNKVRVYATSDWTTGQLKGYQPVRLELVNESNEPRRVEIFLEASYGRGDTVAQAFSLEANGRLAAEMIVPTFALEERNPWGREYSLRAQSGGKSEYVGGICGEETGGINSIMVFTHGRLDPGQQEAWAASLATDLTQSEQTLLGIRGAAHGHVAAVEGQITGLFNLSASVFEFMPSSYEAYTSLDCVVVDLSLGVPPFEKLEPLLAYARLGGNVAFLGEDAVEKAAQHELLAPWLEERFALELPNVNSARYQTFRCGLGTLVIGETLRDLLGLAETQRALRALISEHSSFVPTTVGGRNFRSLKIPGVEKLPYRVFVALLILFAIIIGPVNFILVRKSGKPALLLLTIPAISFIASLLLLGYGVLYQGLDTKSSSVTLACLDQRSERVNVVEDRHTFVGLATESGLLPAAGTVCIPMEVVDENARFEIRVGESNLLSSAFFQSRQDMHQRFLSQRTSRLRLGVEKDGQELRVTNGFTSDLSSLFLVDDEDQCWSFSGQIPQGATVALELASAGARVQGETEFARQFCEDVLPAEDKLARGTYCAELEENIFQDDCGLELNQLAGRHGVIGTLAPEDFQ